VWESSQGIVPLGGQPDELKFEASGFGGREVELWRVLAATRAVSATKTS